MTLQPFDHVLFLFLALVAPVIDAITMRRIAAQIRAGQTGRRMDLYRRVHIWEWIVVAVIVVLGVAQGRAALDLGLVPGVDGWAWGGYALSALICGLLFVQARQVSTSPKHLASFRKTMASLDYMMPHSLSERGAFDRVSFTVGICEELIFRGFMIAYLQTAIGITFVGAALLSSLAFGVAHMYQGPLGVVRTGLVGLALAALYGITGSLWGPIVVHVVMDLAAGRMAYAAANTEDPTPETPELAA